MRRGETLAVMGLGLLAILAAAYAIAFQPQAASILAAAAVCVVLGVIFWKPYLGIALMLGSLAWEPFANLGGYYRQFTSVTALLGAAALAFHLLKPKGPRQSESTGTPLLYVAAGMLLVWILVGDQLKPISTGLSYPFTYLQLLIFVWLSARLFRERKSIESLMVVYIAANLLGLLAGSSGFQDLPTDLADVNRLAGVQGNANEFAVYLSCAIIWLIYFALATPSTALGVVLFVSAAALTIPIILSGSRGAILFLLPVLAFQLWRIRRKRLFLALGIPLALVLLAAIFPVYVPSDFVRRVLGIPQDILAGSDTVGLRYGLWSYGLSLWSQQPVLGIGSGMFVYYSIGSPVLFGTRHLPLHSTYLTFLVENGVVGLLLFLGLIARSLLNYEGTIRSAKASERMRWLAVTWEATLLILLLNGLKGDWNTNKLLWFCMGLSMLFATVQETREHEKAHAQSWSPALAHRE